MSYPLWRMRFCAPLAFLALLVPAAGHAVEDPRKREPTSWEVTLAPPGEPGEPFEMSGVVRSSAGDALARTKVFLYHADAKGSYTLTKDGPLHLAGVLRTDSLGRYRIRSVFPGTYGYPAHVHWEVLENSPGQGFVNVRPEGRQAPSPERSVVVKRAKDGVWRLRWDLQPGWSGPYAPALLKPPEIRYPPKNAPGVPAPVKRDTTG